MVYKFFDKKSSGSGANERNYQQSFINQLLKKLRKKSLFII